MISSGKSTIKHQASNLKGSIKVLFAVFPVGFVPALVCFLIEKLSVRMISLSAGTILFFKHMGEFIMNFQQLGVYSFRKLLSVYSKVFSFFSLKCQNRKSTTNKYL